MTDIEQQNIQHLLEEDTERLDLLQKSREVEEKQRQRLHNISKQRESLNAEKNRLRLFEENNTTAASILDQEDAIRKQLVDAMVKETNPSNAPVVRVLTNIQGKKIILPRLHHCGAASHVALRGKAALLKCCAIVSPSQPKNCKSRGDK